MNKDNPQPHRRPQSNGALAELRAVPVAWMQFKELFEVPGSITSTGLRTEHAGNKRRCVITYLPQIQHFQIQFYKPGNDNKAEDEPIMVWVGHVNWWKAAVVA